MIDDDAVLEAFRPCLRYDSQAVFSAVSAASMVENPGNHLRRGKAIHAWAGGVPELSLATLAEPGHSRGHRLHQAPDRIEDALRLQRDRRYADTVHGVAHRHGERVFLQYWLWFYGKDAGALGESPRDCGIWRLVQVELAGDGEPTALVVDNERQQRRLWSAIETVDGAHPVVYVASRAQCLYLESGWPWRGLDYDGSDGKGREVIPRLEPFAEWKGWPGRWSPVEVRGSRSPATTTSWGSPDRVGRASWNFPFWFVYAYLGILALPIRLAASRRSKRAAKPEALTLNARLERDRIVVGYRVRKPVPSYLVFTAYSRDSPIVARKVTDVQVSGEETIALSSPVDACELRVSAFGWLGRRTQFPAISLNLNEPDALEAKILEDVVEAQLASDEVQRFAHQLKVKSAVLRRRLEDSSEQIWTRAARELQTFRDARSEQSLRRNAEALVRRARGTLIVAGGVAFGSVAAVSALAIFSDDTELMLIGGGLAVAFVSAAIALSWAQWGRWRSARREGRRGGESAEDTALVAARDRFERALREKGVAPLIREEINATTMKRYADTLRFGDEGLSELRTLEHEIPTKATEQLAELTGRMRGGSIGIAGPRGAGKTTLIESYCTPRTADDRRLTTVIAAPVRYEARDFVLTLFARLCEGVLGTERVEPGDDAPTAARLVTRSVPLLLLVLGAGVLGWLAVEWKAGTPAQLAVACLSLTMFIVVLGLVVAVPLKSYLWAGAASVPALVVLVLLALPGHLFKGDLYLGWLALLSTAAAAVLAALSRPPPAPPPSTDTEEQLAAQARAHLRDIRFQQSYSTGYSGKLSLAGGAEASVQTREDLAQRQASLPEIVEQLRTFLGHAARTRGGVAIGIDEMDKIESAEVAQQFLNEIKGIFGVERCFYLVSISENAMASFERRGLPLRDVFDSSFDEVLSVRPLTLRESKLLLRGRVLGLGPAYLDLCHCLSGGLARDVLRVARQLSLLNPKPRGRALRLPQVVQRIAATELSRKIDAVTVSAQRIALEPHVSELMFWIRDLRTAEVSAAALLECCARDPRNWPRDPDIDDSRADDARALERLRLELATFTYFVATLLEFFADDAKLVARIRRAEAGEKFERAPFDRLAGARVAFGINSLVAVEIVNDLRRGWKGWQVLSFASPERTVAEPNDVPADPVPNA